MSQSVVPQVDVGSLTLRGLSAFTPLLAALTADNVAPTTMLQLENLGTLFHVNGPYAARVPDLLRRCSSVHIDQMAMSIGWRKDDAASIMAQSSGGQAVALLCFCLANTCVEKDMGPVIYDLSEAVLARSLSVHSSVSQLADAASLLAGKLQVIGFGNILAEHVVKIHDAYSQLGLALPRDFYDFMTRESMVEFYRSLSIVFEHEDTILRISGTHTMGHITTILLLMFPENVMLTIEGLLVREGPRVSIILEIDSSQEQDLPTTMQIEKRLNGSFESPFNLEFVPGTVALPYTFTWSGHIADALEIEFMSKGVRCSKELREACCDVLVSSLSHMYPRSPNLVWGADFLSSKGFVRLLGSEPTSRMSLICSEMFRTGHSDAIKDIGVAHAKLVDAFHTILGEKLRCTCHPVPPCDISKGWGIASKMSKARSVQSCLVRKLWLSVGAALERAYHCSLIDAQISSTCVFDIRNDTYGIMQTLVGLDAINAAICQETHYTPYLYCNHIHYKLLAFLGHAQEESSYSQFSKALAYSNEASTVLPSPLLDLRVKSEKGYRYKLFDGQLVIKGRYHRRLDAAAGITRPKAATSLVVHRDIVQPSSSGEHSRLSFTLRESLPYPELRTNVLVRFHSFHLDFKNVILGAMGLDDVPTCDHNIHDTLDPTLKDEILTTSVATVQAEGKNKIAIVQTMSNPTAQMLACDVSCGSVLQRDSCLNCAVKYAKSVYAQQVIVAV